MASAMCFGSLAQRAATSCRTIRGCVELARQFGRLVVCDINIRKPFVEREILRWSQDHCDWLKVSEDDCPTLQQYCANFLWESSMPVHILTSGAEGASLFGATLDCRDPDYSYVFPAIPTSVVDTVGCSDAYFALSSLAACLGRPAGLVGLAGSIAAAAVAQRRGNESPVTEQEFLTIGKTVI